MADYRPVQGLLTDHCIDIAPFPGALAVVSIRPMHQVKTDPTLEVEKPRPAVLSRLKPDGQWIVWGLTGKATFEDGSPRKRAPGLELCGLAPGYVWGGHAAVVPEEDVIGVVWAAPYELLLACATSEHGLHRSMAVAIAYGLHRENEEHNWLWPKPSTA